MPKIDLDYSNTMIYKITCKDISCQEMYIGYTTNFTQRKYAHKKKCLYEKTKNNEPKLYKVIRENGGWDNWTMEIISYCICTTHYEAIKKQEEYILLLHATLNSFINPISDNMVSDISNDIPGSYDNITSIYIKKNDLFEQKKQEKQENATLITPDNAKVAPEFYCKSCDYFTSRKSSYDKHLYTGKHLDNAKVAQCEKNKYICNKCEKEYNSRYGLWNHNKTCLMVMVSAENTKYNDNNEKEDKEEDASSLAQMFMELMKQNKELQNQLIDMAKEKSSVTNMNNCNYNNNNTINNKFNLQIFLNETCKDAMNIQEFIDYVTVQHSDFENFGKMGYVEALTRIFLRNLMELEVHKRPIHCSDLKRDVLYVKDNDVWVSDVSREKLIRTIKYIANKNVKQIPGWMDKNPDSKNTQTKLHDKYMRMLCFSMGAKTEEEDQEYYKKIIRNVAKEVCIDKAL